MSIAKLSAEARTGTTKGSIRSLRKVGKIPGVIYGTGMVPQKINIDEKALHQLVMTKGEGGLLSLEINNNTYNAMIKELQRDAIKGTLLHVDLLQVSLKDKIETRVSIVLTGNPEGLKEGGVLQQQLRELEIKCLPTDIPDSLEVDISNLKVGDNITAGELSFNVEILNSPGEVIATILAPRLIAEDGADGQQEAEEKIEE